MKFTKMSLVAALLIGSSAFAIENVKVTGDANVFYQTSDNGGTSDLLEAASSSADTALNLNVTADLLKNDSIAISAGAGYTVLSTLGLENNLVGNVWGSAHTGTANGSSFGDKVENANWINEAWVAATAGKSTVKIGRMELDTPIAFTETWSIEKNTFEAAVLVNQDIPDTTLVAAYVGNGNGTPDGKVAVNGTTVRAGLATGGVVNTNGDFTTYGTNGAYAVGAINNSWKPLTAQAWYYDVVRVAQAYWLQFDGDASDLGVDGLTAGFQYTGLTLDKDMGLGTEENTAAAAMIGYAMKDMFSVKLAYSQASSKGSNTNVAYNTAKDASTAQSKLYTEAWWNYGQVTIKGAKAINLTVEAPTSVADLGLYVTNINQKATGADLTEATLTASKSIGALDATAAYIYANPEVGDSSNTVQVYLTLNF